MSQVLEKIYKEIKSLRQDLVRFLPFESLEQYSNSKSILVSYKKALKKHPNLLSENGGN